MNTALGIRDHLRRAAAQRNEREKGFSLLELFVAMVVFLIVSAAAFSLFSQQQAASLSQQGQVGLNIALRNAVSQLEMDVVNAGTGYFPGVNIPGWPVGVSIVNNVVASGASCFNSTTLTYTSSCFDQINILVVPSPPVQPNPPTGPVAPSATASPPTYVPVNTTDSTGGSGLGNCSNTSTGQAYVQAAVPPPPQPGSPRFTLAQTAAEFQTGDQLLFMNSTGTLYTTVVLTATPTVSGSAVLLTFNPTNANGSNSAANDPLSITTDSTDANNKLTTSFCGSDWALKLAPITYQVNSSNTNDPKLTRTQYGSSAIVMEQVIGFKVGATIWNSGTDTVSTQYYYNASQYANVNPGDEAYNFTLVRSVRISLIGRTAPSPNPDYTFRNVFDGGAYQVQGIAVVVNPRNMSMND